MAFLALFLKRILTIKTPEVIFHIRLRTLWLSSLLILKKYLYATVVFLSVIENRVIVLCPSFLLFLATRSQLYSQLERPVEPRKIFIMPCHYQKIMPAQQPIRTRVLLQPYNRTFSTTTRRYFIILLLIIIAGGFAVHVYTSYC